MASTTELRLRGLVLSAADLQDLTGWPQALIEDYLNIVDNLITISNEVDKKNDFVKTVTLVDPTMSPYSITYDDEEIFFDTSTGDIIALLPEGIDGTNYRLVSIGTGGNKVDLTPDGLELLFGVNAVEHIYDYERLLATYSESAGGWN